MEPIINTSWMDIIFSSAVHMAPMIGQKENDDADDDFIISSINRQLENLER